MKKLKMMVVLMTTLAVFVSWSSVPATATQKYAKETGKKCTECHTKIPKKDEKDHHLSELGKKFAENDHKLPK